MARDAAWKRQLKFLRQKLEERGYTPNRPLRLVEKPEGFFVPWKRASRSSAQRELRPPLREQDAGGVRYVPSESERPERADPELTDDLRRVIEEIDHFYHGDRERIAAFLDRPHLLLDERTPFEVARSGKDGAERVLEIIRRAAAGVAV